MTPSAKIYHVIQIALMTWIFEQNVGDVSYLEKNTKQLVFHMDLVRKAETSDLVLTQAQWFKTGTNYDN